MLFWLVRANDSDQQEKLPTCFVLGSIWKASSSYKFGQMPAPARWRIVSKPEWPTAPVVRIVHAVSGASRLDCLLGIDA